MCRNRILKQPGLNHESFFTATAIKLAILIFPSADTQKQRDEVKMLREKQVKSHERTLELQRQMHEILYQKRGKI